MLFPFTDHPIFVILEGRDLAPSSRSYSNYDHCQIFR